MSTAALMREAFVKAQNYLNKVEQAEKEGKKPERDLASESLCRVLRKELPLRAHAHRADDILTILRIAKEFDINVTLEHCTEGHKIADIIAGEKVAAVVGPSMTARSKYELKDKTFETPAILAKAGVKVALMTDHPVIPVNYLPIAAGLAVRHGLPEMEALKAITINAAEILGVADRVGSLEKGKDADVVIFNGHPLETMTKVEKVFINGELVYSQK
jgi:imidazolonepropionase-like amidohydrolase